MAGFGDTFLSTFGIALGGLAFQIGMLSTVPQLIGSLSQLIGLRLYRMGVPRLRMITLGSFLHGFLWIGASYLAFTHITGPSIVWILMGLAVLQQTAALMIAPAWNSLIGDLVPPGIRGRYLGFRNQRSGWSTVFYMLLGGWILSSFRTADRELLGFASLFFIAGLARIACAEWLNRYREPGYTVHASDQFSLWDFLKRSRTSNFTKFVFFYALMNGFSAMAGPYIALYFLRDLKLSYLEFSIISASQLMTQYVFMQNWGKVVDEFGSRRILSVCGTAVCFTTLMLLVSSNFWWLIFTQMYSGMFWAGFNLASVTFMFDAVTPQKRAQCAAYMGLMNCLCICIGAMLGAAIVSLMPSDAIIAHGIFTGPSIYFKAFLISCLCRMATVLFMLPRFREVREVAHVHTRELIFRISYVRAISGATFTWIGQAIRREDQEEG